MIGVPDSRWGEVGCAIVVRRDGTTISVADLLAHCATVLARYKIPRSVIVVEALPRNAAGKVHKPTLRRQFGSVASENPQT